MILQSKVFWECYESCSSQNRYKEVRGTIVTYTVTKNKFGDYKVKYLKTLTASFLVLPHHVINTPLKVLLRGITRDILINLTDIQYDGNFNNYRS